MSADENGEIEVAIFNPVLFEGTGISVRYDHRAMPHYIEWRMMGEGQYAVGIEPCTNGFGRERVRNAGELVTLQPGDSRSYRVRIGIIGHEDAEKLRSSHIG